MNPFARALKVALTYRLNVLGCILTSVAVALLWGGNLTAVFPLVDVIMNDSSLPKWIDLKIEESNREVAENERWLTLLKQFETDKPAEVREAIQAELKIRRAELAEHIKKSTGEWNDVQIAEKTRLQNFIARLEALEKLPPPEVAAKIQLDRRHALGQISSYKQRRTTGLDLTGRPSLVAHHAFHDACAGLLCRVGGDAREELIPGLEPSAGGTARQQGHVRSADEVLCPNAASGRGQLYGKGPRRLDEPLYVGPRRRE